MDDLPQKERKEKGRAELARYVPREEKETVTSLARTVAHTIGYGTCLIKWLEETTSDVQNQPLAYPEATIVGAPSPHLSQRTDVRGK